MQADVNLKNFSGNPVVEYLSRFWLQGTCSGETTVTVNMTDVTLNEVITELKSKRSRFFLLTASW